MENVLLHGDCLELMKDIPNGSVDMVLADLPYGTTACKWDTIIPFEPLWKELNRICKDNAAMVFTASQPFTSQLINSNLKQFRYELIWEKSAPSDIACVNIRPLKYHENLCIFYKNSPTYNKQMVERDEKGKQRILAGQKSGVSFKTTKTDHQPDRCNFESSPYKYDPLFRNPGSILKIKNERGKQHPTQKPVALMEYLIKTYTNEGDLVLDPTMGSGTTCVAAKNLGRKYIGIEKEQNYYDLACRRLL